MTLPPHIHPLAATAATPATSPLAGEDAAYPPIGAGQQLAPVVIRDSRPEDLARVHAIYAPHVLGGYSTFEEVPPDVPTLAARRDDVLLRGMPYLVAELDGVVQAYAYAGPFRLRSAYRYTVEDSIYVERSMVGRGIGRSLLAELVARCTALGMRQMIAVIGSRGPNPSIRMHARLGFREEARLPGIGYKFGEWMDCTIMQLPLGAGSSQAPGR